MQRPTIPHPESIMIPYENLHHEFCGLNRIKNARLIAVKAYIQLKYMVSMNYAGKIEDRYTENLIFEERTLLITKIPPTQD